MKLIPKLSKLERFAEVYLREARDSFRDNGRDAKQVKLSTNREARKGGLNDADGPEIESIGKLSSHAFWNVKNHCYIHR